MCERQLSTDQRPTTALLIKKNQETNSGSYIYSGSPSGFHELELRTRVREEFLKQKIRKKVWNIRPNLRQLHRDEDDGQGGQDGQEDGQQEEERSDYASPCAAPSFPGSVEDEQLPGEIASLRVE